MSVVPLPIQTDNLWPEQDEFSAWLNGEFPPLSLQSLQEASFANRIDNRAKVKSDPLASEDLTKIILENACSFLDFESRAIRLGFGHDSVSFLIPVHNEAISIACTVREVVKSELFRLSLKKEILICLNGCTDQSIDALDSLCRQYPEIRTISTSEKNKNKAWELLVRQSNPNSDILFFLDADIRLDPDSFTCLDKALETRPNHAIAGAIAAPCKPAYSDFAWFQQMRFEEYEDPRATQRRSLFPQQLSGACYAIRRENALATEMPTDPRIADDRYLQSLYNSRVITIPDAHVHYCPPSFMDMAKQYARAHVSSVLTRRQFAELYEDRSEQRSSAMTVENREFFTEATTKMKVFFLARFASKVLGRILGEYYLRTNSDSWPTVNSTKSSEAEYSLPIANQS